MVMVMVKGVGVVWYGYGDWQQRLWLVLTAVSQQLFCCYICSMQLAKVAFALYSKSPPPRYLMLQDPRWRDPRKSRVLNFSGCAVRV